MSAAPPITVAIPFFDEERCLAIAVRSILSQTLGDFELLLVDDGSRDRSLEVARSFQGDRRVTVVSDGAHRGLGARLNEVARRARGALVARMDADDISHPARLARERDLLCARGCDAVGSWAALFDTMGAFAVLEAAPLPPTPRSALERGVFPHATMLARRAWLLANPYDESLTRAEDVDLWCRTARTSSFDVVKEPLYAIRVDARAADFAREYAHAQRLNRRLFLRYGVGVAGPIWTAQALLRSIAKASLVHVAARFGHVERLVRGRGRLPTWGERPTIDEMFRSARVAQNGVAHLVEGDVAR